MSKRENDNDGLVPRGIHTTGPRTRRSSGRRTSGAAAVRRMVEAAVATDRLALLDRDVRGRVTERRAVRRDWWVH